MDTKTLINVLKEALSEAVAWHSESSFANSGFGCSWAVGARLALDSAAQYQDAMEPAAPAEHPSVAWWSSCPWISDRDPDPRFDGGSVLLKRFDDDADASRFWASEVPAVDVDIEVGHEWAHVSAWRPPALLSRKQIMAQARAVVDYGNLKPDHKDALRAALALIDGGEVVK